MQNHPPLEVKVWGDFACFTRPEMKVERVTYPVMTPSAARGVLEAIYWKPEFRWLVREIRVLREIRYFSILRNEVKSPANLQLARSRAAGTGGYYAEDDRAQRNALVLRDVMYVIRADVEVSPGVEEDPAKFRDQFRRRVERGQCWHTPYLGCREFTAFFAPVAGDEQGVPRTEDLGRVLFDLEYGANGHAVPRFFEARLEHGSLRVPADLYAREAG
jgi:CRISPR-associated protein Cas5d